MKPARRQPNVKIGETDMADRIRGREAARAASAAADRLPVTLQANNLVEAFQSVPAVPEVAQRKKPPRVVKPSQGNDVILAPTADLDGHRAMLRTTFGTLSEEFAATMMGKLISGLRPNAYDRLGEATLNAALATVASLRPESEIDALICVQTVLAGFAGLRMLELSQTHLGEVNVTAYGGYANKLFKLQGELLKTRGCRRQWCPERTKEWQLQARAIHRGGRGHAPLAS
jgi:hypothetical protein